MFTNCLLFWCHVKSSLEFSKVATGKLLSCVHGVPSTCHCCQHDEFIISQILLQFRKLMNFICPPDANSVHIRFQWQQIVDKLKIIQCINLFHMLNLAWLSRKLRIIFIYTYLSHYVLCSWNFAFKFPYR